MLIPTVCLILLYSHWFERYHQSKLVSLLSCCANLTPSILQKEKAIFNIINFNNSSKIYFPLGKTLVSLFGNSRWCASSHLEYYFSLFLQTKSLQNIDYITTTTKLLINGIAEEFLTPVHNKTKTHHSTISSNMLQSEIKNKDEQISVSVVRRLNPEVMFHALNQIIPNQYYLHHKRFNLRTV